MFAILVSGCASGGAGVGNSTSSRVGTTLSKPLCAISPGICLYDGAYEAGEKAYAEQEAKRLNQAQLRKLRSM